MENIGNRIPGTLPLQGDDTMDGGLTFKSADEFFGFLIGNCVEPEAKEELERKWTASPPLKHPRIDKLREESLSPVNPDESMNLGGR